MIVPPQLFFSSIGCEKIFLKNFFRLSSGWIISSKYNCKKPNIPSNYNCIFSKRKRFGMRIAVKIFAARFYISKLENNCKFFSIPKGVLNFPKISIQYNFCKLQNNLINIKFYATIIMIENNHNSTTTINIPSWKNPIAFSPCRRTLLSTC